jgi:hypothetical protein
MERLAATGKVDRFLRKAARREPLLRPELQLADITLHRARFLFHPNVRVYPQMQG